MTFQQKLDNIVKNNYSLVCVGIDSDYNKIPQHLKRQKNPIFAFNKAIINATHDLVCAYKPNIAFYEGEGLKGLLQLVFTIKYLKKNYPQVPIILDAKRGDIGSTNEGYVKYFFNFLKVDAVTVNPFLGKEALQPFLDRGDKGIFVLCRTSNPGSGEFQDLQVGNIPLYKIIAEDVTKNWNKNGNCMLVVGATYPNELKKIRKIVSNMTLLVPGIGAQGGDMGKTVKAGLNSKKAGMIINSSRGIIYASNGLDFAQRAREEAIKLRDKINLFRK